MSPSLPKDDLQHILTKTEELWTETRGKHFFITGGTGFFGSWLVGSLAHINELLKLNISATLLTRDIARTQKQIRPPTPFYNFKLIEGNIVDFSYPEGPFEYIIHAAGETGMRLKKQKPSETLDKAYLGTKRILDFATIAGTQKLLLTSSGAVYGQQPQTILNMPEDYTGAPDPLLPTTAYGQGKRLAEHLCATKATGTNLEVKIARCFAFIGPHMPLDQHFAAGSFIGDALHGGPIKIQGDGTACRSYMYAADLAIWLWHILFRAQSTRAYNVGSEVPISTLDLAHLIAQESPTTTGIEIKNSNQKSQGLDRYIPSTQRAQKELGLKQYIDNIDAIKRTMAFHRGTINQTY